MQKLAIVLVATLFSITGSAQSTTPSVEERCTKLEQKVSSLENQIAEMTQRMSKIENDNVYYRGILDYGKAITECDGNNGVHYKVVSVIGNKEEKTVSVKMQVSTSAEEQKIQFEKAKIYELSGDTHNINYADEGLMTLHVSLPQNITFKFSNIDPVKCQKIKGLIVDWYSPEEENRFENINIDWQ